MKGGFCAVARICPTMTPSSTATRNDASGIVNCRLKFSIECHELVISVTFSAPISES